MPGKESVTLHGRVTRDARHAVEVGVVAGQVGQALLLHHGKDQGVVTQQIVLLTESGRQRDERRRNCENPDAELRHLLNRLSKVRQFLDAARLWPRQGERQRSLQLPRFFGLGLDMPRRAAGEH